MKKLHKFTFSIVAIFLFICSYAYSEVSAQAISLSITPPLLEVTISPAKEYRRVFTIINNGGSVTLKPKIVYFTPLGDSGEVETSDFEAPEWVRYSKEDLTLEGGTKKDFAILITPPEDTPESDHFLTLLLTTDVPIDLNISQNISNYSAEIGANILITISNDGKPKKEVLISEFTTKKYVDSTFGQIDYDLIVKNIGSSYVKPIGNIKTNNEDILKLASVNVLSGYSRKIPCVNNESITDCKLVKLPIIGKLESTVEFTIDEEPKVYKETTVIYLFPFYLTTTLTIITVLILSKSKIILKLWRRKR